VVLHSRKKKEGAEPVGEDTGKFWEGGGISIRKEKKGEKEGLGKKNLQKRRRVGKGEKGSLFHKKRVWDRPKKKKDLTTSIT